MSDYLRLVRRPPVPTLALLRYMEHAAIEDARADAAAGDFHLFQLTGRIYDSGYLHWDAWERYEAAYDAEVMRMALEPHRRHG